MINEKNEEKQPTQYYHSIATQEGLENYNSVMSSLGYPYQDGSTYARPGFYHPNYEDQRPCYKIPTRHADIMKKSEEIYDSLGLVRSIIDLITDFTIQGVRIVHPQKSVEKFYRNWFARVNGAERSERFCCHLYKFGNTIIKRKWAVLNKKVKEDIRLAKADEIEIQSINAPKRRIPARYIFLNPSTVDVEGGELAKFVGKPAIRYVVRIPLSLRSRSRDESANELLKEVPDEMKQALKSDSEKFIRLDPLNTLVFHYKKEDWQLWAKPILYGVMQDIFVLEQLKMADITALEGATDRVRIFKLGSLEHQILPGPEAFTKLNQMLRVNAGAGTRNFVWTPDISIEESSTDVHQFLGDDKYRPTMNAIYGGLGIPPTLTGTNEVGGTTNNLISLKALIKRIDYVRQRLLEFWDAELEIVRQTMGFQKAATIEFDQNNLGDEEAEKRLFIEMADRDIIPYEVIQRKFGLDPESNSKKVEQEWDERKKDNRVAKAGPFHNAQYDEQIKKALIDQQQISPQQAGVELPEQDDGFTYKLTPSEEAAKTAKMEKAKTKIAKKNGRPPQKKDSKPRKQRRFTPVVKAMEIWATEAQEKVAEILNPVILSKFNKKNMRSLTAAETEEAEKIKFAAFFNLEPFSLVNSENIGGSIRQSFPSMGYKSFMRASLDIKKELGRELTIAELHSIQVGVYLDGKN